MNHTEQSSAQPLTQREGIVAELACLACVGYLFGIAGPAVQLLPHWWEAMLVYLAIPLSLTFTLLHGSHIHREMSPARRAAYLLGTSGLMFAGAVMAVAAIAFCGSIFAGLTRGHF